MPTACYACRVRPTILVLALFTLTPLAAAGDDWATVRGRIESALPTVKSFTARVSTLIAPETAKEPQSFPIIGDGTFEAVRQGEITLHRMELNVHQDLYLTDGPIGRTQWKSVQVHDGKSVYSSRDDFSQVSVYIQNPRIDPLLTYNVPLGGKALLDVIEKSSPAVLPDETVDGREQYVVRVSASDPQAVSYLFRFDKATGITVEMSELYPDGKQKKSTRFSDLVINPQIDTQRFEFVTPPGASVIDQRKPR